MNVQIQPSHIQGSIVVPASKSLLQRACAAALLCGGKSIICNGGISNDDLAALNIIRNLGAEFHYHSEKELEIKSNFPNPESSPGEIHCGESGLSARMFTPIAALLSHEMTITGSGSLKNRPLILFDEIFPELGVTIESNKGKLPLKIKGPLNPVSIAIDGSLSSQFLTGLLFAYAAAKAQDVTIQVRNLQSRPYIDLTLSVLKAFGMNCPEHTNYETFYFPKINDTRPKANINYTVPGDWSNGAVLLVAGAVAGTIAVSGLDLDSEQADKKILEVLMECGAPMSVRTDCIEVSQAPLNAFHFDAADCPDLFPPLVALAAYCRGTTAIEGLQRLIHKESNRAETLKSEFEKLGIEIDLREDTMLIKGGPVRGGQVDARGDHRIAMACAVAALGAGGPVEIANAEAVEKSYPAFYRDLARIGMECKY
jgi:3-phosphoshikimate 1-carboxyvinyltransferase